jgi:hypothetical protein
VGLISGPDIEGTVLAALGTRQPEETPGSAPCSIEALERVVVAHDRLLITTAATGDGDSQEFSAAWPTKANSGADTAKHNGMSAHTLNEGLIQSIARAHAWVKCLREGAYQSVEQLAEATQLHPKVVRQSLRLAFLSPELTSAILEGAEPAGLSMARIPKQLSLPWADHRRLLG